MERLTPTLAMEKKTSPFTAYLKQDNVVLVIPNAGSGTNTHHYIEKETAAGLLSDLQSCIGRPLSLAVPESALPVLTEKEIGHLSLNFDVRKKAIMNAQHILHKKFRAFLASRDEEVKRLREALEKIANPIKHLESELQPGQKLNGVAAIQWSENGGNLSKIAQEALEA